MTQVDGLAHSQQELDPTGVSVGLSNPYDQPGPEIDVGGYTYPFFGSSPYGAGCRIDGIEGNCGLALRFLSSRIGVSWHEDPMRRVTYNGSDVWATFRVYGDGYAGYVPSNANYMGNGVIMPIGGYKGTGKTHANELYALARLNGLTDSWAKVAESSKVLRQTGQQPPIDKDKIRKFIEDRFKDKCKDFVEKLITEAAGGEKKVEKNVISTDLLTLFDKVAEQGGFKREKGKGTTIGGYIQKKNATVYLSFFDRDTAKSTSPGSMKFKFEHDAIGVMHELIHLARKSKEDWFDDKELAQAARELLKKMGKTPPEFPEGSKNNYDYSAYWEDILRPFCFPDLDTGVWRK